MSYPRICQSCLAPDRSVAWRSRVISAPNLQYAMSVLWAFVESWVAKRWGLDPGPAHGGIARGWK